MRILADTSIWIESVKKNRLIDADLFESLLLDSQIVTCLPIRAELFSGTMSEILLSRAQVLFDHLDYVDADWNASTTWQALVDLIHEGSRQKIKPAGLVDRMILFSALKSQCLVWTLDRRLRDLARIYKLAYE